jgi:hypothetical protein
MGKDAEQHGRHHREADDRFTWAGAIPARIVDKKACIDKP